MNFSHVLVRSINVFQLIRQEKSGPPAVLPPLVVLLRKTREVLCKTKTRGLRKLQIYLQVKSGIVSGVRSLILGFYTKHRMNFSHVLVRSINVFQLIRQEKSGPPAVLPPLVVLLRKTREVLCKTKTRGLRKLQIYLQVKSGIVGVGLVRALLFTSPLG